MQYWVAFQSGENFVSVVSRHSTQAQAQRAWRVWNATNGTKPGILQVKVIKAQEDQDQ